MEEPAMGSRGGKRLDHVCPGSLQMSGGRAKGERWGARDQSLHEAFAWPPLEPAQLDSTFPDGGPSLSTVYSITNSGTGTPRMGLRPWGGVKQVLVPLGQSGCKQQHILLVF